MSSLNECACARAGLLSVFEENLPEGSRGVTTSVNRVW